MKKTYLKPTMEVIQIQQMHLLSASPYDNQKSLNVYDDEGDVIEQKSSIW